MARLIEEQIIAEDATTLTIRFTRQNGKYLDQVVNKVEGMTNEELLNRWHRRMTLAHLQRRILPNKWTTPENTPQQ